MERRGRLNPTACFEKDAAPGRMTAPSSVTRLISNRRDLLRTLWLDGGSVEGESYEDRLWTLRPLLSPHRSRCRRRSDSVTPTDLIRDPLEATLSGSDQSSTEEELQ